MRLHWRLPTSGATRNTVLAVLLLVMALASEARAQAPDPPTQYAPNGSITNPTPTYTWSAVAGANQYFLEIDSPTAPVFRGFYFPADCSAGICSATPGIALAAGPYGWYVQAQGPGGRTWSWGMGFTVVPPPAATQVSPSGATYTPTPAYTWNASAGATSYFLQVSNGAVIVFQGGYPASQVCSGATCSLTAPTPLAQGAYSWAVQSRNASGGTWSANLGFSVQGPPAPALSSPTGTVGSFTPTYRWSAVGGGVTLYNLAVDDATGSHVFEVSYDLSVCAGATCTAVPGNGLAPGSYTAYVRGRNATGAGAWSAGRAFSASPPAPAVASPSGATFTPTPTYTWNASAGATSYFLQVGNGAVIVFQGGYPLAQVCSGATCSLTAPTPLAQGSYNWAVQAKNGAAGVWSASLGFTVQGPPAPALSAPTGTVTTPTPLYSWNAVGGAPTSYMLSVEPAPGSTGTSFQVSYTPAEACSAGTCSATPPNALIAGPYTSYVRGQNATGYGAWSGGRNFTVVPPSAPAPSSPSGAAYTPTPTYTWSAVSGATQYSLEVDSATARIFQTTYPAASVCSGNTCSATPTTSLAQGSYVWLAQAGNASGGTWSVPTGFTVQGPPVPTPQSPTGSGTNATPTYTWTAVGGAVLFYVLSVNPVEADGTPAFEVWYPPSVCGGATCSATPTNVLKAGSYTWQIRGRNAAGPGDLSNPMAFTVTGPPAPIPFSPNGPGTTVLPTFSWSAVGGDLLYYTLGVNNVDPERTHYEIWYEPSVCSGGTCSVTPSQPLRVGSYTWAVRGRNAAGPGAWSDAMAFTVQAPAPPTPLAPMGKIPTETPTFSWTVSPGAMYYTLSVLKPNGSTLYSEAAGAEACNRGICSLTPAGVLGVGEPYRWRVRGEHLGGIGEWSALLDFHVASLEDCDLEFVTADFNGDGRDDGLCQTEGDVYVALGDGAGGFGVARVWLVHTFARLMAGDFDGDGKTDLADVNVQTGDFLVARANSTGSAFEPLTSWGIARATWGGQTYTCQGESLIAGADRFDPDVLTDVYCRDSSLKFFKGLSTGTAFAFSIIDDPPPAYVPVQEYIYAGPRPLAITGVPR